MKLGKALLGAAFSTIMFASISSAQEVLPDDNGIFTYHTSPRWRESESHPLRTAAYVLHPVGWVLREGIYRPWSYFVSSTRFTRSFFGYREPFDYRQPLCFFDSDKIPDCNSLAPYNALGGKKGANGESEDGSCVDCGKGKNIYFPEVAFDFNKATLNDLGKSRVRQASQILASNPAVKVIVEGHADYVGSDDYNMKLGQKRAETVMKELSELGVDAQRMTPVSFGEGKPLYTEQEDWARAANRRVQFSVQGTEKPAEK
ncbi:MAG: OmpA family protein [Proteobacteria bacterium]|nr:OmpA family protein [Pseudomonadota bacterium]